MEMVADLRRSLVVDGFDGFDGCLNMSSTKVAKHGCLDHGKLLYYSMIMGTTALQGTSGNLGSFTQQSKLCPKVIQLATKQNYPIYWWIFNR